MDLWMVRQFSASDQVKANTHAPDSGFLLPCRPTAACSSPFSVTDFFKDCPWLNVPLERQSEILIEPLHPRGKLLGGSSQGGTKMSKLAALAAARKKKENEKVDANDSKSGTNPVSLLDKLSINASSNNKINKDSSSSTPKSSPAAQGPARKYPARKAQTPLLPSTPATVVHTPQDDSQEVTEEPAAPVATPSTFARTILGSSLGSNGQSSRSLPSSTHFSPLLCFGVEFTESDSFSGPSPDDIVANAQSASKGLMKGGKKE